MREHTVKRIPATRSRIKLFSVAAFLAASLLFGNLARIAVLKHDYYTNLVFEEITTSSPLLAKRGTIYDCNMNVLATTGTVYRIFLSTKDVSLYEKKDGKDYGELIAKGLSEILKVDRDVLLSRIRNTKILDVTVKANASEEEYEKVLKFLAKEGLGKMVFAEAQSCREYPNATLAAHLLGFCGSENQGLYGLEYSYNEVLSGKNGRYLYAKDANGYTLDTRYADYTPATDGASLVTTIDAYVQTRLEAVLEEVEDTYGVQNRVCGIVMDTKTGAILAMATSSPFNPNEPSELSDLFQKKLDESGLSPDTEEYAALKRYLREVMWSNKATDEIYEPGSTFKIVTVSAALDLGAVSENDRFSCHGYLDVGGRRIRCHKISGHGSGFTLAYGLQMSCNPTMMQVAAKIGASDFYDYVEKFGYFEDTGIDLPSEGNTASTKRTPSARRNSRLPLSVSVLK